MPEERTRVKNVLFYLRLMFAITGVLVPYWFIHESALRQTGLPREEHVQSQVA